MKALILAGGEGTRLWPLSQKNKPKQFLAIEGPYSFLQKTVHRIASLIPYKDIFVITNERTYELAKEQLAQISPLLIENILREPLPKNTALAIAFGIAAIAKKETLNEEEPFFVFPSDHEMEGETLFHESLLQAEKVAKKGFLTTFGIVPTRPETGYGYILEGEKILGLEAFKVEKFIEKPVLEEALFFCANGSYLWNAGIFCATFKLWQSEYKKHLPPVFEAMEQGFSYFLNHFSEMPSVSLDYGILEKSENVAVLPLKIYWSDVGTWDSVYDFLKQNQKDKKNIGHSNITSIDSQGNLLVSPKKTIALVGVNDLIVVDTEDALMILKRGDSQLVKALTREGNPPL